MIGLLLILAICLSWAIGLSFWPGAVLAAGAMLIGWVIEVFYEQLCRLEEQKKNNRM